MAELELRAETTQNGALALVPFIDGTSLVGLVAQFETAQGYAPAGAYSGIIPAHFDFGDLARYYTGREERQWPRPGHAWLLGCDCGEVGCWPLTARLTASGNAMIWSHFEQEHRPSWDYAGFGPFIFEADHYKSAVAQAVRAARD